jgi:hypothetical protein
MLIDVFTQAVETHFDDHQNAASHFDKALAAGNINKLLNPVPQVSRVSQPFASFDGKHAEIGKEFYTRVSERLRHKQRAITGWDYERIILDRFPSIYKIKCIGHTDPACLCRDFEKPMAADTSLDEVIETASIKYKDEFETDIKNENSDIIKKILKKIASDNELVYIIGHYDSADGTVNSRELNEKRLAELENWLVNKFSVDAALIRKSILPDGIENRVDLEQRKPKKIKETIIGKVCCGPQVSPGHVLLIPIADLKNRNALNPLQPKTSRKTLLDIEAYCKKMTSPFVKVHAKNPVYEEILVSCKVKFHRGTEKGFYLKKLNEDIKQFLTPWAFDETAEIVFGQKIYASSIINFIEGLPYVDFITDFLMFLCENPCCPDIDVDPIKSSAVTLDTVNSCCDLDEFISTKGFPGNTVAKASGPRTILVSAARHDISLYEERPTLSPCQKVNLANTLPPKRGIEEKKSVAELLTKEKAGERKSNVVNPAGNTIAAKKKQKK